MTFMEMQRTWSALKALITSKWLPLQYNETSDKYYVYLVEANIIYYTEIFKDGFEADGCDVNQNTSDRTDFENNYKATANAPLNSTDIDGTMMIRPKAAKKGWVYAVVPIEVTTATLNSLVAELKDGTSRSGVTLKLYDNNDTEITDSANEGNCVKTVVTFEPTYDYEIIGGQVTQGSMSSTDLRIWVTAVPDIPAIYGGSKEFVGGLNLRYVDKLSVDGRVSKLLSYDANYHTNKMEFVMKHDAGAKQTLMILMELFRA